MMKKCRTYVGCMLALLLCLTMFGCGATKETQQSATSETASAEEMVDASVLTIKGLGEEDYSFTAEEIKAMDAFDEDVESLTSSGEINKAHIKGTTIDTILDSVGLSKEACETVRIVASDGYEISVPNDVLQNQNFVIAYEEDGVTYDPSEYGAFRTIIPDERAMYWVKGVVTLQFEVSETVSKSFEHMVFVDNMSSVIPFEEFEYYDEVANSLSVEKAIHTYATIGDEKNGFFIAGDGLETEQTLDILNGGIFKMSGEDAPMFINPDMPKGMQVKGMKYMQIGDTCFVALMTVDAVSEESVSLQSILNDVGMTSGSYIVTDVDGETVELGGKAPSEMTVELMEDGYYLVSTDGSIKIKALEVKQQ